MSKAYGALCSSHIFYLMASENEREIIVLPMTTINNRNDILRSI